MLHTKYQVVYPFPTFQPAFQLKKDQVVLLNTSYSLVACAVSVHAAGRHPGPTMGPAPAGSLRAPGLLTPNKVWRGEVPRPRSHSRKAGIRNPQLAMLHPSAVL